MSTGMFGLMGRRSLETGRSVISLECLLTVLILGRGDLKSVKSPEEGSVESFGDGVAMNGDQRPDIELATHGDLVNVLTMVFYNAQEAIPMVHDVLGHSQMGDTNLIDEKMKSSWW